MKRGRRVGFTLTELVVVIAIIAVLASLLFMSVLRSRSSSRSLVCKNNLRQIGIALAGYESAHKVFPAAHCEKHFSMQVKLLPWIGGDSVYGAFAEFPPRASERMSELPQIHGVSSYRCPDSALVPYLQRRLSENPPSKDEIWNLDFDFTSYLACFGSKRALIEPVAPGLFSIVPKRPPVRVGEVRRGLSNTLAVSEGAGFDRRQYLKNLQDLQSSPDAAVPLAKGIMYSMEKRYDDMDKMAADCINGVGTNLYTKMVGNEWIMGGLPGNSFSTWLPPNARSCYNKRALAGAAITPSSHHGDWVHASFGDGSVRSISNDIDPALFAESGRIGLRQNQ